MIIEDWIVSLTNIRRSQNKILFHCFLILYLYKDKTNQYVHVLTETWNKSNKKEKGCVMQPNTFLHVIHVCILNTLTLVSVECRKQIEMVAFV